MNAQIKQARRLVVIALAVMLTVAMMPVLPFGAAAHAESYTSLTNTDKNILVDCKTNFQFAKETSSRK